MSITETTTAPSGPPPVATTHDHHGVIVTSIERPEAELAAPQSSASSDGSRMSAMLPLRVRGIERVRLHADLTILAKLACALARSSPSPA